LSTQLQSTIRRPASAGEVSSGEEKQQCDTGRRGGRRHRCLPPSRPADYCSTSARRGVTNSSGASAKPFQNTHRRPQWRHWRACRACAYKTSVSTESGSRSNSVSGRRSHSIGSGFLRIVVPRTHIDGTGQSSLKGVIGRGADHSLRDLAIAFGTRAAHQLRRCRARSGGNAGGQAARDVQEAAPVGATPRTTMLRMASRQEDLPSTATHVTTASATVNANHATASRLRLFPSSVYKFAWNIRSRRNRHHLGTSG